MEKGYNQNEVGLILGLWGSMLKHSLFSQEEKILADSEYIAGSKNHKNNSLYKPYMELMNNFRNLYKQFKNVLRNDEEKSQTIEKMSEEKIILEAQVKDKDKKCKALLDNTRQGFLSIDSTLMVEEEHSLEAALIFETNIAEQFFPLLLYPSNEKDKAYLRDVLERVFSALNQQKVSMYTALLPDSVQINGRFVDLQFRIINDDHTGLPERIMVILTDKTEERILESTIEQDHNVLKMVVKAVRAKSDLLELNRNYKEFFIYELNELLDVQDNHRDAALEIFKKIYTFKGMYGLFDFDHVTKFLQDFEAKVAEILQNESILHLNGISSYLDEVNLMSPLNEDMDSLKAQLGNSFFEDNDSSVKDDKLYSLQKELEKVLTPIQIGKVLPKMLDIRQKSIQEMLDIYPQYVHSLAKKAKKSVEPLSILGSKIYVDPMRFGVFVKSLVHVFKNIVDHGIEEPSKRLAIGKGEFGRITCMIKRQSNNLIFKIEDDGKGIPLMHIKEKAIESGLLSEEDLVKFNKQDVLKLIFQDQLSASSFYSDISGRGMGMSAVLEETQKLGGDIVVESEVDKGTSFVITIPYDEQDEDRS